jgi:hypothetical protein
MRPSVMKKFLLLCTICLSVFPAGWAQDWNIVVPGRLYNYSLDSVITTTIRVDSAYAEQGDSVYVLNRVCTVCNNCENKYFSRAVFLNNKPVFLQGEVVRKATRDFHLRDTASFVIRSAAGLNESWLFDTVNQRTATLRSVTNQVLFGSTADSVMLITVADADTILLSKHYGIVKFPDFRGHHYRLLGVEGPNPSGKRNFYFPDFFNMETGDVFQYHIQSGGHFPGPNELQKHTVTYVENYQDSVIIHTSLLSRKILYDYYTTRDTVYTVTDGKLIYQKPSLSYLNRFILEKIAETNPVNIAWNNEFQCLSKNYEDNGLIVEGDTVYSSRASWAQDKNVAYEYGVGIGLIHYYHATNRTGPYPIFNSKDLLGYTHKGNTYGTVYDDAVFKEPVPPQDTTDTVTCSAYPTFFEDAIHLYCSDCEGKTVIRIMDLAGTIRYEKEVADLERTTLYPERLERGVYILEIRKKNAAAVRTKVVKK